MGSHPVSLPLIIAAVLAVGLAAAQQQTDTPSCASKLVPCANYLNSTNPPPSCCNPIKEAMATEKKCLCDLYNTPGFLQSLGINITQALQLTKSCGVNADSNMCKATASPPSASTSPPGLPGSDNNAARRMTMAGVSMVLLASAAAILY